MEDRVDQHKLGVPSLLKDPQQKPYQVAFWTLDLEEGWGGGLGVGKYWVSVGKTACKFSTSPFHPCKEVSAEMPEQDLCLGHQIKRPRNDGAWAGGFNMCKSLTSHAGLCPWLHLPAEAAMRWPSTKSAQEVQLSQWGLPASVSVITYVRPEKSHMGF